MKKVIALALILLTFSCSSDNEIIGTIHEPSFNVDYLLKGWRYDTLKINGVYYNYEHNPKCNNDYFGFVNRPTQPYHFNETTFTNDYCTNNSANLEWKIKKDEIFLYFGTQLALTYKVLFLDENNLILSIKTDIDNDGKIDDVEIIASPYDPYNQFGKD